MPIEQGYQSRIDPREGTPTPLRSPAGTEAIGAAVSQLGAQMHGQQLRSFKIEQQLAADQELADSQHRFALHRQNLLDVARGLRETAPAGAAGHTLRVKDINETGKEAIFAGIRDPRVQRHMQAQWDEWSTNLLDREAGFEQGKRIAKLVDDGDKSSDIEANIMRRSPGDQEVYKTGLKRIHEANALLHIDEDTRAKLDRAGAQKMGVAFIQGLQDSDPDKAKAAIDSGAFDHLGPDVLEQLRSGTDVEIRRREAAAEHEAAVARAQTNDLIGALKANYQDGVAVSDADWAKAIELKRAMGDLSGAAELEGMRADNRFAQVYEGQSPLVRQNRLAALQAKGKRSADEDRELKWLTDHREKLDSRFNSDPVGFALEHGTPGTRPPAGDLFADPGVMAARVSWARSNGAAWGRSAMPLFTRAEAELLATRKKEGVAGESEVMGLLDRIPDEGMRQLAARQVDSEDKVFQHMVLLRPKARATVRAGQQALAANQQLLKPDKDHRAMQGMIAFQEGEVREAMKLMQPEDVEATLSIGRQFVAGIHSANNISANETHPVTYNLGFRVAMGGAVQGDGRNTGGIGHWAERPYVLPSGLDEAGFANAAWKDRQARKVEPRNPDGSVAEMRFAHPVYMGVDPDDPNVWLYRWETKNGRVIDGTDAAGKPIGPFISRIRDR